MTRKQTAQKSPVICKWKEMLILRAKTMIIVAGDYYDYPTISYSVLFSLFNWDTGNTKSELLHQPKIKTNERVKVEERPTFHHLQ